MRTVIGLCCLAVCACAPSRQAGLASGSKAYDQFPASAAGHQADYDIGPQDVLKIVVFGEPELTFNEIQVDTAGNLRFPLIGSLSVAGKTPSALVDLITARLNERFLRSAQVTVVVVRSVAQRITIEGSVQEPGVYELNGGSSTLLEAIARAKSPTRTANLTQVVVFRTINGQRTGARFDLRAIRAGQAPDPLLRGGDIVVVGFSAVKGVFRDFLTTAPFFNVFTQF